jgi:2-dehydropantoate 2-reductase
MRIAIFGTGGVGGYFGGRLAQAGEDVIFIARGKHLNAIRDKGLRVDSIKGNFVVEPVHATDDPAEVGTVDAILVGVKAWQVSAAARAMGPMIGPKTFVVPLQNGVEAPSLLSSALGHRHVLGGLCWIISYIADPGHIDHIGAEPRILFGELDNHQSDRVESLRAAFGRAIGVTAETPTDIHVAMWQKFICMAAWSGLGAVTRSPIGIFRSLPETRQMLEQKMQEIYKVAQALKIRLSKDVIEKTMDFFDGLPQEGTASMQRDIMSGRPSELDTQNGAVVRLGRKVGIDTPVNSFIYQSLLPMEKRARGQIEFAGSKEIVTRVKADDDPLMDRFKAAVNRGVVFGI